MVYDCFIFFDELDLLEIRLTLLDDVVDGFIIVESNATFSGNKKNYNFKDNKERFAKWLNKITYIETEQSAEKYTFHNDLISYNPDDGAWKMESNQRNALSKANHLFNNNDKILLSDLDEIPDPLIIKNVEFLNEPKVFQMLGHYYFLNCQNIGYERLWKGTVICSGSFFKNNSAQSIRERSEKYEVIQNAGWHFSYLGGVEKIKYKIRSFAHTELNKEHYLQDEQILKAMHEGHDLFKRPGAAYKFFDLSFYPSNLRKIMIRYPHLINTQEKKGMLRIIRFKLHKLLTKK